jgi:hypothetical protein
MSRTAWVHGIGHGSLMAFTDFGIDNLILKIQRSDPTQLKPYPGWYALHVAQSRAKRRAAAGHFPIEIAIVVALRTTFAECAA